MIQKLEFKSPHEPEFQEGRARRDPWLRNLSGRRLYQYQKNRTILLLECIPLFIGLAGVSNTSSGTGHTISIVLVVGSLVAGLLVYVYQVFKRQSYTQLMWQERQAAKNGPAQSVEELKQKVQDDSKA